MTEKHLKGVISVLKISLFQSVKRISDLEVLSLKFHNNQAEVNGNLIIYRLELSCVIDFIYSLTQSESVREVYTTCIASELTLSDRYI